MTPRIASSVLVSALIRKAEGDGGFAAVLAKGDPTAGALILILTARGADPHVLERLMQGEGKYAWVPPIDDAAQVPDFIARRRRFDPDLWVLELDVPSIERFTAEMNAFD